MPRLKRRRPREVLAAWPRTFAARVAEQTWDEEPLAPEDERLVKPAHAALRFATNLRAAIDGRPLRDIAELCGVDHAQIVRVLSGASWPDLVLITQLEDGLGVDLFPRRSDR
ncbi:helix-turn-helix domain-containing protein [Leifsonia naganoensis]|uniref:XRE family transcriptional regulator n=1 Tax=Leifsonia naganoensis TaxID=150025 RepID=A0A853DNI8_9MICO|nr:helix-turn-helix transcriptional regulator [Leifsonia naganoensis]NYK09069.1 hypothetical protein [Leifsonia naganoensis]